MQMVAGDAESIQVSLQCLFDFGAALRPFRDTRPAPTGCLAAPTLGIEQNICKKVDRQQSIYDGYTAQPR